MDAVQPWGELTSHPHTTKIQDPNVDNCSLSEPLWDFCREDHYIPESWAHDDLELPNLHKKAGMRRCTLGPEGLVGLVLRVLAPSIPREQPSKGEPVNYAGKPLFKQEEHS